MSGHSKWATTKRAKAVVDAKRASVFTRLAHAITLAAREKGGDSATNFSLRLACEKARDANMPKDNIERAIRRGTGEGGGVQPEEIVYEGYGPGGIAILIHTLTDNRNRTVSELKHILSKHGGNLGSVNSVAWMFERQGVVGISGSPTEDQELGPFAHQDAALDQLVPGANSVVHHVRLVDDRQARDLELAADAVDLFDGRVGVRRHRTQTWGTCAH